MRLLYIQSHFDIGGINKITSIKENYLSSHGYEVHNLCTLNQKDYPPTNYGKAIILHKIDKEKLDSLLSIPLVGRIIRYFYYRLSLLCAIFSINPDIIITNQDQLEPLSVLLLSFWKKRILEIHGSEVLDSIKNYSLKARFKFRTIYKLYNIRVTLTERDSIKRECITRNKYIIIPNPIEITPKEQAYLTNHRVIILSRFVPQKGLTLFLPSWKKIEETHPDWILDIYGEGVDEVELKNIARDNKFKNVKFHPYTPHPSKEIVNSSILLLPSIYEGFPLILLEAMALGVPCIAYDCPCGPNEIIKNDEDGFVTKYKNPDEMIDKVIILIENEALRKDMGQKARENIQRYSLDNVMVKWEHLFNELKK